MSIQAPETVDLTEYVFSQQCERCDKPAAVIVKGCMDKEAVTLCDPCLKRGLDVIATYIHYYQRLNKRVLVCQDCSRPILTLETHIDIRRL